MQTRNEFPGNKGELLMKWVSGISVNEIMRLFRQHGVSTEQLSKFIEEFFAYLLPWGISAFIKVACKELQLDEDNLPTQVKSLSSMVKYGVPTPTTSWTVSGGIPIRETAIRVASQYEHEIGELNHERFVSWLRGKNTESLQYDYGLRSPLLEDVSKSISRTGSNQYLRDHSSILEILPLDTWVVGISYENRAPVAISAKAGDRVELLRDYGNAIDRNAILVKLGGRELGFIERDLAQLASVDVDCGLELSGSIVRINGGTTPQVQIRIEGRA
jgi:hypothetical protein